MEARPELKGEKTQPNYNNRTWRIWNQWEFLIYDIQDKLEIESLSKEFAAVAVSTVRFRLRTANHSHIVRSPLNSSPRGVATFLPIEGIEFRFGVLWLNARTWVSYWRAKIHYWPSLAKNQYEYSAKTSKAWPGECRRGHNVTFDSRSACLLLHISKSNRIRHAYSELRSN